MTCCRHRWLALTSALACLPSVVSGAARAQAAGPFVHTAQGEVQGVITSAATEFLGIPYAAPPVGQLRWTPPQPAKAHPLLEASALPSPCPQPASLFGVASTDEDCLYLNIYAPNSAGRGSRLPVMLWIHGGAFVSGTGDQYDGSALVQHGVIVVTINYRLGWLGFLATKGLDASSALGASGDYGLMDQQAALRWVADNIAGFGGDPRNITIFGESAGGQSVFDQLASPTVAGLYKKAIVESGGYAVQLPSHAAADASGASFSAAVDCAGTDLACLRKLSVPAILAAENVASITQFEPDVGTAVLPTQPLIAFATGAFNRVPVLDGSNHDEGRLFVDADFDFLGMPLQPSDYDAVVTELVGAPITSLVTLLYPLGAYAGAGIADPTDLAYATVLTDSAFSCSALAFDQLLADRVPVFAYEFADEQAGLLQYPVDPYLVLGAPHASELPFLWPSQIGGGAAAARDRLTPGEVALEGEMEQAWTNFARAGDPNGPGVSPAWPAFSGRTQEIEELVPGTPTINTSFGAFHKCDFWEPVLLADGLLPPGTL